MLKKKMVILDLVLAAVFIFLDQLTKYLVVANLKGKEAIVLIDKVLELDYLENRGSAFGMFQNQKIFLLTISVVFMLVVFWVMFKTPSEKKYLAFHLCLSGILAGGIGNMIDRVRLEYVVDFISFVLIHFPVFNVADCYIVVSIFSLMFLLIFFYKDEDLTLLSFKKKNQ